MVKGRKRYFSAAESAEVWDRWQRGEGLKLIGRVFGKTSSSIFAHLRPHGGIRPVPRRRSSRGAELVGTRGGLAGRGCGGFAARDRGAAWPGGVDGEPGAAPQRRSPA